MAAPASITTNPRQVSAIACFCVWCTLFIIAVPAKDRATSESRQYQSPPSAKATPPINAIMVPTLIDVLTLNGERSHAGPVTLESKQDASPALAGATGSVMSYS